MSINKNCPKTLPTSIAVMWCARKVLFSYDSVLVLRFKNKKIKKNLALTEK